MSSLEEGFLSGCDDYIRKPFEIKRVTIKSSNFNKKRVFK